MQENIRLPLKMEGKAPANVIEDRKKSLNDAIEKKSQLEQIIG